MSESDRAKWDARYREPDAGLREPSGFLASLDPILPRRGRALDVAGGLGRHALWLARRGLDVTLTDISEVALEAAGTEAVRQGLRLRTLAIDLEVEPLPPGPWDVIVCVNFLHRPLFEVIPSTLAPGGLLVVSHPTRSNLQRHARPGPSYLLEDSELPSLVPDLEIQVYDEGWRETGRHEAWLMARRSEASLVIGSSGR